MVYYKLTKKKHINLRDAWNHMNLAMVALTNFGFKVKKLYLLWCEEATTMFRFSV